MCEMPQKAPPIDRAAGADYQMAQAEPTVAYGFHLYVGKHDHQTQRRRSKDLNRYVFFLING